MKRTTRTKPQAPPGRGFTLVEMLVVIAVILLLGALIIPSVSRMREAARSAQCTSNLRQLYTAAMNYASTGNSLPYAATHQTMRYAANWSDAKLYTGWVHWDSVLRTRWFGANAITSIEQGTLWDSVGDRSIYICPTFKLNSERDWNLSGNNEAHRSYVMSRTLSGKNMYTMVNASRHMLFADGNYHEWNKGTRISGYGLRQNAWPHITDGTKWGSERYGNRTEDGMLDGYFWSNQGGIARPWESIGTDHGGLGNVVFADGHAAKLSHTNTIEIYEGTYIPQSR